MAPPPRSRSFKHAADRSAAPSQSEHDAQPQSFWRKLFGGKTVTKEHLKSPPKKARTGPLRTPTGNLAAPASEASRETDPKAPPRSSALPISTLPHEARPRNPKSFLAKKFNSQVVKAALLDAIGEAMDKPPRDISPIDCQFWVEGLALKGIVVEQLDCAKLRPQEHLRAIQWMAKIERLHPLKATYREDLFVQRYQLQTLHLKETETPEAVGQGGVALRRLSQVIRTKFEGLGAMTPQASAAAQREVAAYERLMEAIERAPLGSLPTKEQMRLSNILRRIDPYKLELTTRSARFDANVTGLIQELDEVYALAQTEMP